MKINELENGMRGMFVDGKIVDISDTREVNTRYGTRLVADVILEDNTGRIKLSLWEDMIDKVTVGDVVSISGAYVTVFRNELQLNIAREGKLEVKRVEITKVLVRDTMGDDDYAVFVEDIHEHLGALYNWEDARDLKEQLENDVNTCPRCNNEEDGEGALLIKINDKPYNICRTHFAELYGYWPFKERVKDTFDAVDAFYKHKLRGIVYGKIEHKQVLVKSRLTKFKKDESQGSAWRYFNDNVVKALGGRWLSSENGWLFQEDQEWVDGGWRLNGERAQGEWRLRKRN
jgi:replication factor A1